MASRFFLTRRRGERGGRKIGFSPRAPRLRVNRCIPLLHNGESRKLRFGRPWERRRPRRLLLIGRQATSLKTMATKQLIRSRFPAKKTFGETFGAATGVGAPSYRDGRLCRLDGIFGPGFERRSRVTWGRIKRCIRLFMTGARATSGGDRAPRGRLG